MLNWTNTLKIPTYLCLAVLQLAFFTAGIALTPQPTSTQNQQPLSEATLMQQGIPGMQGADPMMAMMMQALTGGLGEMGDGTGDPQKSFAEQIKKMQQDLEEEATRAAKQRKRHLEALPQNLRDSLEKAEESYQKFLKLVDIRFGLTDLCQKIELKFEQPATEKSVTEPNQQVQKAKNLLQKLQKAISTGGLDTLPAQNSGRSSGMAGMPMIPGLPPELLNDPAMAALFSGQANPFENPDQNVDMQLPEKPVEKVTFESTDFTELFDILAKLWPTIKDSADEEFKGQLINFRNITLAIKNGDRLGMIKRYLNYIKPKQDKTYNLLKETQALFRAEYRKIKDIVKPAFKIARETSTPISLSKEQKDLHNALNHFHINDEFAAPLQNILAFAALRSDANSIFLGTENLFNTVALLYDISGHFVSLIKKDTENGELKDRWWWSANAYNWGFSVALAAWYSKHNNASNAAKVLSATLTGNMPLDGLAERSLQSTLFTYGNALFMIFAPQILNLTKKRYPGVDKQFENVATSVIHVVSAAAYSGIKQKLYNKNLFNPNDPHFKDALYECGEHIGDYGYRYMEQKMWQMMPNVLGACDKYSMGIIQPEMIRYFSRRMLPILLYTHNPLNKYMNYDELGGSSKPADITSTLNSPDAQAANATINRLESKKDLTDAENIELRKANAIKTQLLTARGRTGIGTFLTRYNNYNIEYGTLPQNFDKTQAMSFEWYCFESCVTSYVLSCVGRTVGDWVAKHTSDSMLNGSLKIVDLGVDKFLSVLHKLHFISEENRNWWAGLKGDALEWKDDMYSKISLGVNQLFIPGPAQNMFLPILLARGDISEENLQYPAIVNRTILFQMLRIFMEMSLMTASEAYTIMGLFDQKAQSFVDDEIVDKVVNSVIRNVISWPLKNIFSYFFENYVGEWILSKGTITDGVRWMNEKRKDVTTEIRQEFGYN